MKVSENLMQIEENLMQTAEEKKVSELKELKGILIYLHISQQERRGQTSLASSKDFYELHLRISGSTCLLYSC